MVLIDAACGVREEVGVVHAIRPIVNGDGVTTGVWVVGESPMYAPAAQWGDSLLNNNRKA